jgi:hypothetical protein
MTEKQMKLEKAIQNCLVEFSDESVYNIKSYKRYPRTMKNISVDVIVKEISEHLIRNKLV